MADVQLTNEQAAIIGLKIRETRIQQGLQQKDLVQGEFSKSYISLIESGRVMPSAKALKVIAQRLSMSVEQLLGLATPGNNPAAPADGETEVFLRWDLVLDEARLNLAQAKPDQARNVLLGKIKTRQLSSDQLKSYHYLLGCSYMELEEVESALTELKTATQIAHSLGDEEMEARINHRIGMLYSKQNKFMLAIESYRRALELIGSLQVLDPKLKQNILASLGECYHLLGDKLQAATIYRNTLEISNTLADLPNLAATLWDTSQSYRDSGNLNLSKQFAGKSLAMYEAMETFAVQANVKTMLGLVLIERKEYDTAQEVLETASNLSLQLNNKRLAAIARLNLSYLYGMNGHNHKALDVAQESLHFARESGDQSTIGQALAKMAQAQVQLGHVEKASETFVEALELLKDSPAKEVLSQTYFDYGQVLSQLGRTEEALRAMETAYNLQTGARPAR